MGCSFLLILPYFSLVSQLFEMTITLKSTTFDPNTQTITVIFDPPVPPGNTVSIGLKPVRNPDYGGVYQFGITAYPPGENSPGLYLGVGRLAIYEAGDRW